jgi:3-hydroxyisobutyrate dehydrogenase-like beta-hydroxyacid dehydrogenase
MDKIADQSVTVLGLGQMGSALARTLIDAGYPVTVWNRTSGRERDLVAAGAEAAASVTDAASASPVVVVCLLNHASVQETLGPVSEVLRSRIVINPTTTTPNQARDLSEWAGRHGIDYLDAAIMAVPAMIGSRGAQIFYSGSRQAYDANLTMLDHWATSEFRGNDAGLASLLDLAMLSGMYHLFAGFFHGAAMVGSASISATEFAARQAPFLAAMTDGLMDFAKIIDGGDYTVPGQQSLDFSDHSDIIDASDEQGVDSSSLVAIQQLLARQIAAGHGSEGYPRIYQSLRTRRA